MHNSIKKHSMKSLDQIIHIHIPRTAGTSIKSGLFMESQPHFFARKYIQMRPDWSNCFKFSFVRNPWDRAVSLFSHQNGEGDSQDFKNWLLDMVEKNGHPNDRTIEWKVTDQLDGTGGIPFPWKSQTDWLIDYSGNICMDFIGRFENLNQDIYILEKLIGHTILLPHLRKTKHGSYQDYYLDQESIDLVADWGRKDIENFGYSFE